MTNETTNQESTEAEAEHVPSAFETELAMRLRDLCVGRVNAAFILAKMLAPLYSQPAAAGAEPEILKLPVLTAEEVMAMIDERLAALQPAASAAPDQAKAGLGEDAEVKVDFDAAIPVKKSTTKGKGK